MADILSGLMLLMKPLFCSSGFSIKDLNTVMNSAAVASSTYLWSKERVEVMTVVCLMVSGSMMFLPPPTARMASWGAC